MSARRGVLAIAIAVGAVACRAVVGIEDLSVDTDAGADAAGDATGDAASEGGDGGGRAVGDKCASLGAAGCATCCRTELAQAWTIALRTAGIGGPPGMPDASSPCACGQPTAAPCGMECGGIQTVCVGSPAGSSTEAACTTCVATNLVKNPSCNAAKQACLADPPCAPVANCLARCP